MTAINSRIAHPKGVLAKASCRIHERLHFRKFVCSMLPAALGLLMLGEAHGMQSGFGRKKEVVPTIKSDVKYIKCEACQLIAKQVHRSVAELRTQQPSWKKLTEEEMLTHLEGICNPQKEEGEWLTRLDVKQQDGKLRVVEMNEVCVPTLDCIPSAWPAAVATQRLRA